MKRIICFFVSVFIVMQTTVAFAEGENSIDLGLNAKSVLLMEQSTGNVLYEENPDEQLPIASVTKIMTMLLIMEAVDSGKISVDDMVTVSENAMSYGGSTMFLEAGEQLTVNDMLKGIAVASANDGAVAMAEHIAGSEGAFVDMMNEKAKELGMENTHFVNTNGLDADNHYSSARDVAIMSRELIEHEKIFDYTSIWMDTLRGGKFQLANTNKLIRFYDGANGLKTGSTSKALCCLSATAKRDNMQLIAVVLGAPTSAERFASAKSLLDYGFANYAVNTQINIGEEKVSVPVEKGVEKSVSLISDGEFKTLVKKGSEEEVEKEIKTQDTITAPIKTGDKLGSVIFKRDGEIIYEVELKAANDINKKSIGLIIKEFLKNVFFGNNSELSEEI